MHERDRKTNFLTSLRMHTVTSTLQRPSYVPFGFTHNYVSGVSQIVANFLYQIYSSRCILKLSSYIFFLCLICICYCYLHKSCLENVSHSELWICFSSHITTCSQSNNKQMTFIVRLWKITSIKKIIWYINNKLWYFFATTKHITII